MIFLLLLAIAGYDPAISQPQSKYWYQNGKRIDFGTFPPQVQNLPTGFGGAKAAANGVYGPSGNTLFYVIDNKIYRQDGSLADELALDLGYTGETSIVPVPSECGKYFIIYNYLYYDDLFFGRKLMFSEWDMSLNNGQGGITPGKKDVIIKDFNPSDFPNAYPDPMGGMAVSKLRTNDTRYLYVSASVGGGIEGGRLLRYTIDASGINNETILFSSTGQPAISFANIELDLSHNELMLAFGNTKHEGGSNDDVIIIHLDANGNLNTALGANGVTSYDLPGINTLAYTGVEFSPNNGRLYVGVKDEGIRWIDLNSSVFEFIPNTLDYGNSQLEFGYSTFFEQYIYAANSATEIGAINVTTNALSPISITGAATITCNNPDIPFAYYTLPDQVDGENYNTWFEDYTPDCCALASSYNEQTYVVQSNAIWTPASNPWSPQSTVSIGTELRVPTGVNLTIKDMIFEFNVTAGVTVENGAKLTLDNTTFTAVPCESVWEGVDVWGVSTLSQYGNVQGELSLKNGAVIEHAEEAFYAGNPANPANTAGGIIRATNSFFRNNHRDITLQPYQNFQPWNNAIADYVNQFQQSDFIVDEDYRFDDIISRVYLADVRGIKFNGCHFINTSELLLSPLSLGIESEDGGFTVRSFCTDPLPTPPPVGYVCPEEYVDRSYFSGFYYAIRASHLVKPHTFRVSDTDFENNICGIQTLGINDFVVTGSSFLMGEQTGIFGNFGILINTGTGFRIQDNDFNGTTWIGPFTWGTFALNTGASENLIYANRFNGLTRANTANGTNRDGFNDYIGLQYRCNYHTANDYDMFVVEDGIRGYQGALNKAAGNTYSRNGNPESDYYNHSVKIITQYYKSNPSMSTEALDFTPNWFVQTSTGSSADCPSNTEGLMGSQELSPAQRSSLSAEYDVVETDYQDALYLYQSILDDGNKPGLIQDIKYDWSDDAWEMRDQMLSKSPNLSTEVLLEAAKTGVLPDALLTEILMANIKSCKDKRFLEALLYEIPNPLPGYIVDMLAAAESPATMLTILENAVAEHSGEMAYIASLLIGEIHQDTTFDEAAFSDWLQRLPYAGRKYEYIDYLLSSGQGNLALTLLNQLPDEYQHIAKSEASHADFEAVSAIRNNVLQDGRSWSSISNSERAALENIAASGEDYGNVIAHNILRRAGGHHYDILPYPIPEGQGLHSQHSAAWNSPVGENTYSQAFPTPARDFTVISWQLPSSGDYELTIRNANGLEVEYISVNQTQGQYLWDTRQYGNGFYTYTISDRGEILSSGKIIIAH